MRGYNYPKPHDGSSLADGETDSFVLLNWLRTTLDDLDFRDISDQSHEQQSLVHVRYEYECS